MHRVLKYRHTHRLLLTTLDSALRVQMLVKKDEIVTLELTDVLTVYQSPHPRNGVISSLLNHLHQAVNEAINLPTSLSEGVEHDDIEIDTVSEDDSDHKPPYEEDSSQDDADWDKLILILMLALTYQLMTGLRVCLMLLVLAMPWMSSCCKVCKL